MFTEISYIIKRCQYSSSDLTRTYASCATPGNLTKNSELKAFPQMFVGGIAEMKSCRNENFLHEKRAVLETNSNVKCGSCRGDH